MNKEVKKIIEYLQDNNFPREICDAQKAFYDGCPYAEGKELNYCISCMCDYNRPTLKQISEYL